MFCPALLTRVPTVVQEYVNKQSREWGRGEMDMLYVYALKSRSALFVYIASRCVCFAVCVCWRVVRAAVNGKRERDNLDSSNDQCC